MLARLVALFVVVTVLPTVEVTEQAVHAVDHLLDAEPADHSAHHENPDCDEEHGCTGLIHVCGCHHTLVTATARFVADRAVETLDTLAIAGPCSLHDQRSLEPPHRPPIA